MSIVGVTACGGPHADIQCEQNSNCDLSSGGRCIAAGTNMWCAYPDPECPGGYRYSDQDIGDGLSGMCVDANPIDAGVDVPTDTPDADLPAVDWATRHGGPTDDRGLSIAVAPNGDLVMAGTFTGTMNLGGAPMGSAGGADAWVARYSAAGTFRWSTKLGGIGADLAAGVAVDPNGDVYVVGSFVGPVDFGGGSRSNARGGYLVKLAGATGAYVWDRVFGTSVADNAIAVAAVDANTVAIGGRFTGTVDFGGGNRSATPAGGFDSFVAAYNTSTGASVWSNALTTTGNDGDFGALVAVGGDVYVTASYFGTATLGGASLVSMGQDIFVARYAGATGAHVWSIRAGGADSEFSRAIASDGTHVFVGGMFLATTNLGGANMTVAGGFDAFVASYNIADGTHAWSQRYGGANTDIAVSLAANASRLAVGISFAGPMTLGTQMLTPNGVDVAITRLNPTTGTPTLSAQLSSPANDELSLAYAASRLAGVGTFSMDIDLFGAHLSSDGGTDIASFAVDF